MAQVHKADLFVMGSPTKGAEEEAMTHNFVFSNPTTARVGHRGSQAISGHRESKRRSGAHNTSISNRKKTEESTQFESAADTVASGMARLANS